MGDKLRGPKTFIARIQESQESYEQFMRHKKYDSAVFEDSIYLTLEADFKKEFPENYLLWKEEKDRKSKLYYFVIFFEANQNFSLIKGCISYITDEVMFSAKAIIKEIRKQHNLKDSNISLTKFERMTKEELTIFDR